MANTNYYGLHGKLSAQAGKGEALASILLEAAALMEKAPGCHLYVVGRQADTPDDIWVSEIWDTKDAHDQSLDLPGVKELISQAMPLLAGPPAKGQELDIFGGHGIG
ncbi:MAG: antibiotic biosynthesis monooxygenase [Saprospiraceae bacterium]|nr:antibiotic biosynthesis monooxygenase [Saprospiraceae bacterium]